jgi:hypothetical protein
METNPAQEAQDLLVPPEDESPDYLAMATAPINSLPANDEKMTNFRSLQAAIAMSKREAGDPDINEIASRFEKYKGAAANDAGYLGLKRMVMDARASDDTEGMRALMEGYINTLDPDKAADMAVGMGGIFREIQDSSSNPDNYHSDVLDTIAPTLDEETHNNMVVQQHLAEMSNEIMQKNEGFFAKVQNYGGLLLKAAVWPIAHDDVADFTDTNMLSPGKATEWFDAWNALPAAEKIQAMPELKQRILEATNDNPIRAMQLMGRLMSPYGDQRITADALMEGALVGGTIATPKTMMAMVRATKQAINPLAYLSEAAKVADAAKLNSKILTDATGKISDVAGVPRDIAATNAMPYEAARLDPSSYVDGISGQTMKELRQSEQELADFLRSGNPLIAEPLHVAEIAAAKEKYLAKWRTFADEPGSGFNKLTLKGVNDTSLEAEVTFGSAKTGDPLRTRKGAEARLQELVDTGIIQKGEVVEASTGRFLVKSNDKYIFTQDDVGAMSGTTVGPVQAHIATPSLVMAKLEGNKVMSESANAATRAELGGHILANTLQKEIEIALKPIGRSFITPKARARLRKIDEVLLQGDAHTEIGATNEVTRGKVYTIDELRSGVHTPSGLIKLDDDEISAYFGIRRVLDHLFIVKNDQARKTLAFRGFRRVDVEGEDAIGTPIETAAGARAVLQGKDVERLYSPLSHNGLGGVEAKANISFEDLYDNGSKMVKLEQPAAINGSHYDYVFVNADRITDLPGRVLNYKIGYVPKIYKNAFYFVKENMVGSLNGVENKIFGTKTLRIFDSKKEADAFLAKQKKTRFLIREQLNATNDKDAARLMDELRDMGHSDDEIRELMEEHLRGKLSAELDEKGNLKNVFVLADRDMAAEELSRESYGVHGGLFTSRRATHDILFGVSGEVPKRYSAFESIQRYTQHVSNYYPRNEWRLAAQQRWMNTARAMKAVRPGITKFREAIDSVTLRTGSPEKASLDAYATFINDQARIPTNEEVWLSQHMRSLVEWAETPLKVFGEEIASAKLPKVARTFTMNLAQKDPFAVGRAVAFHALLGWFGPVQLFVQAQGASIAFSLHPLTAMNDLRRGFGLTTVMFAENPAYIRSVGKAMGLKPDEFEKMLTLFKQAGLRDSIRATADHSAAAQSYGIGLKAIKDAADKGLMFYRRGELFNRTYSFSAAVEKWLAANPGKSIMDIGDKELKGILDYTMHISLNMTRANRASWQKGIFSLPTQFMQIQAKWVEAMMPTMFGGNQKFSAAQRRQFVLMQFALYGAAGVPLGKYAANYAAQQAGVTPEQLSPETLKYLNGGVWDLATFYGLGANVELGGRGSITDGLVENMVNMTTSGKSLGAMFGAFGQVSSNLFQGFARLKPLVANAEKVSWTPKELAYVANELAKTASTWNNLTKAYAMQRTNMIVDNQGRVVVDAGSSGFDAGTIMGQALGFRPSEVKFTSDLRMANKAIEEVKKDFVQGVLDIHYRYLGGETGVLNTKLTAENAQVMMDWYRSQVDEATWHDIQKSVQERITSGSSEKEQQIMQWYRNYSDQLIEKSRPDWLKYNGPFTNLLLSGQPEASQKESDK